MIGEAKKRELVHRTITGGRGHVSGVIFSVTVYLATLKNRSGWNKDKGNLARSCMRAHAASNRRFVLESQDSRLTRQGFCHVASSNETSVRRDLRYEAANRDPGQKRLVHPFNCRLSYG